MTEQLQIVSNHTTSDKLAIKTFDLTQNYTQLLNTLEQLALGLETTFANLSIDHKAVEISLNGNGSGKGTLTTDLTEDIFLRSSAAHGHGDHHMAREANVSRVFGDIWIGVILTLLIVSVIFFICAGFLYHKYKQWKNAYRANQNEHNMEICRHCPPDFEAESLPSYTIVSGLPTYDDALEEFRKAGIILTPPVPIIKIFDVNGDTKDSQMLNFDPSINDLTVTSNHSADGMSLASVCTCGANSIFQNNGTPPQTPMMPKHAKLARAGNAQVIELSPEQLAQLSHKRLSLQITFNNSIRRHSRQRVDLYRAANRNNLLRLSALNNANARNPISQPNSPTTSSAALPNPFFAPGFPSIHRSTSSGSLINEQMDPNSRMQHRGSLS